MRQQISDFFARQGQEARGKRGRIELEAAKVFSRYIGKNAQNQEELCRRIRKDLMCAIDRLISHVFRETMSVQVGFGMHAQVISEDGAIHVIGFDITSLSLNGVDLMEPHL